MNRKNDSNNLKIGTLNNKLFDYSKELVMLNYLFELKLLSKDEMLNIKRDIMKSYQVKSHVI